jgi:hypothetical protein
VHAALVRADERAANDVRRFVVQPDVVERELQRFSRTVDEGRDLSRDVERRLAAVGEGVNLDQDCYFVRSDMRALGYVRVRCGSRLWSPRFSRCP